MREPTIAQTEGARPSRRDEREEYGDRLAVFLPPAAGIL
jgi:hypothetical protein